MNDEIKKLLTEARNKVYEAQGLLNIGESELYLKIDEAYNVLTGLIEE